MEYKVAKTHNVRGASYHKYLKNAKESKIKHGSQYNIYRQSKVEEGWDLVG